MEMDFFDKTGEMAIGSRLRMLTDAVTADASRIYKLYGIDIKPKWFPIIFVLSGGEKKSITGIAKEIGHSHPSVSNIAREMIAKGLMKVADDKEDKRICLVALSKKGMKAAEMLKETCRDVQAAVESILKNTRNDLWRAIGEWEEMLAEKSLLERVKEARKIRESGEIEIVSYKPLYNDAFKSLNEEWIARYFKIEPHDLEYLNYPKEHIIDRGGFIFVALYKKNPVGVCALCKMDVGKYDYELAKLAVSPKAQGKGIGMLLCRAAVDKVKSMGAKTVFLESNTILKPAIHTYKKLGFKEISEYVPSYERGNIQMVLALK